MANYQELFDLNSTGTAIRNKVAVACTVKAHALLSMATPSVTQVAWASNTIKDPVKMADKIFPYVLAANKSASVAQITAAADADIQTAVDAAADKLIGGGITD